MSEETIISLGELLEHAGKLASLPDIYLQVRELTSDPDSSVDALAKVLSQDPGMTARLLRLVNSAAFNFGAPVSTVTRAIALLGLRPVHDLVLATSVTRDFAGIANNIMDMRLFWRNSIYRGVIARELATHCNILDRERLFVIGLLCDIGHLLMYQNMPKQSEQILLRARQSNQSVYLIERMFLGYDYAQVSAALANLWCLPGEIQAALASHTEPQRLETNLEGAIAHIGNALVEQEQYALHEPRIQPYIWPFLRIDDAYITALHQDSQAKLGDSLNSLMTQRAA